MDKKETREKVLVAAADLFASRGFYQVSVREICDAAGVTKPVLYYYFKDKEDLLYNLVLEVYYHFNELYNKYILENDSFEENLDGLYQAYLQYALNYPYLIRLSALVFFSPLPLEIKKMSREKSDEQRKFIFDIFIKGKNEGVLDANLKSENLLLSLLGPVSILLAQSIFLDVPEQPLMISLKDYFDFWKNKFLKRTTKPE